MAVATPTITYSGGVTGGGTTTQKTIGFTWTETGANPAYRYNTRLDTPGGVGAWSADQIVLAANYISLTPGAYTFNVRAKDATGALSSVATFSWTISSASTAVPPEPSITAAPAISITTPSITIPFKAVTFSGGGGGPSIQFGWGEGHMESFSATDLADAMSIQNYVFGAGSFVRSNMTKTKAAANGSLTNASWASMDNLITHISAINAILYPTFSFTNIDPVPVIAPDGTMPKWRQMITSGLTYLKSKVGVVSGFTMPPSVEITNEPGNQGTGGGGPISPTQLYLMVKEASIAIAAWNAANNGNVQVHGPGLAGAGNYSTPNKYAADVRDYARKLYAAAKADNGHYLSDWCISVNFHTYYTSQPILADPGSANGHTQYPKSLLYTRADMDAAGVGMALSGSHAMFQGVSEGGFKDSDYHNNWIGTFSGSGAYVFESDAKVSGSGAFSAETALPQAWTYMVNNAATLGIIHINQYEYTNHNAPTTVPNPSDHQELGLGRHQSGASLSYRPKATALKAYIASL